MAARKRPLKLLSPESRENTKLGERSVNMKTALAMASQGFKTMMEKRLMMSAVAKLDSASVDNHGSVEVVISVREFAGQWNMKPDELYGKNIKPLLAKVEQRQFTLTEAFSAKHMNELVPKRYHWLETTGYSDKLGKFSLTFHKKAVPLLLYIRGEYGGYLLKQAASLRSVHSWRLLEIFSQYKRTGWLDVSVEDFAHALEVKPSYRKNFAQLRRWIIEPAIDELRKKDGWIIECRPIKEGRKVTRLRFDFERDPQAALPLDEKSTSG